MNRRRRKSSVPDRATQLNAPEDAKVNRTQFKRRTQIRSRRKALVVKVDENKNWIEAYRNIVGAKSTMQKATGVRKTRAGHILIKESNKTPANEVAERWKSTSSQETEFAPLLTKKEMAKNNHKEMNIQDVKWMSVKSLRKHEESKIPKVLSASEHTYVLHDFKTVKTWRNADNY